MSTDSSSFQEFFDRWLVEQNLHLEDLISATTAQRPAERCSDQPELLRGLLGRVMGQYEQYYRAKSLSAQQDVLAMLSPPWRSTLEDAFLWIGGWRPSMAFHVIYSKSGLQLETHLLQLQGIPANDNDDLADLSGEQLRLIDHLQLRTIREERHITEEMARVQESAADASMVELSHLATQMIMRRTTPCLRVNQRVDATLVAKENQMEELLHAADDLRLRTLRAIVHDILTPIQAVHFLIAVAELHLRLHDWGKRRDAVATSHPSI
ncbi:unnamed protein product [Linum tenue]|uniref:DOG1 domain-containing protein n=1 Tax=Linum tenue TaxID=586396 RepID=A0AAV0JIV0_9ROSI|nr:unnamed protein product [Linum tenue]